MHGRPGGKELRMAGLTCCAIGLAVLGVGAGAARGDNEKVTLRESSPAGSTTRVVIALKAEGLYQPASPPGAGKDDSPKSLALRVATRLAFVERVPKEGRDGRAARVVRRVSEAASAIN